MKDFINCFKRDYENKYHYLGYIYPPFGKDTIPYMLCTHLVKEVDSILKPWYAPRWFLNLLHLYGNDNSIVRVRIRWISNIKYRLIPCLFMDMKVKYGTMRIYGSFPSNIENKVENKEIELTQIYESITQKKIDEPI